MNKAIFIILSLIFIIITSCEEETNITDSNGSITIESPYEDYEFIYAGEALEIIAKINNKDAASAAYISINNNIIASGLSDTLIAYYEPNSNINQNAIIEASLVDEENQIISSDNITISINSIGSNTLNSESAFMNINNEFMIMRSPVTNRQFLNFLNINQQLNVDIVDVTWTDVDNDTNGNPLECEFDSNDNYEPEHWWYVTVTSNYANDNIPAEEYVVYRNAHNIYDGTANFSDEAGRIQYDCETEMFYLPNEEDGTESIYLDHPVIGVSWIGANIYANYFGWELPTIEQWKVAAGESWLYPWTDNTNINENYANYDNDNTSEVKYYNGLGELNLSLSAYGLYDMAGNVWEYTSTPTGTDAYIKTGGAFDSEFNQLEIGYIGYALWEHVSYNTGFRCIANNNYISAAPSGCMEQEACNYDNFSESSSDCFEDDCLHLCGGDAQEFEFYQDLDGDGFGNSTVSELQCNESELGWADNTDDIDDNCFSNDIAQENIDCNNTCDGSAYHDGCNECVEGTTGNEPCTEDCNGDEGGDAVWDDCGVCSGGNAGHEANSDIDDCGVCFGNGYQNYCIDINDDDCCDCNDNEGTCNLATDNEELCESEIENHIDTILACSNSNAENYYCDEPDNECTAPLGTPIIPCNLIDDGSCIVYGCSDDGEQDWSLYPGQPASNYNLEYGATICEDGSLNNCCEYTNPLQLSFGNVDLENGTMEILIVIPEYENVLDYVYGFQFNVEGATLTGASGGLAEAANFSVSTGGSLVLGFSFSGDYIGQNEGVLTTLSFSSNSNTICLELGTGGFSNGYTPPTFIPVLIGDCYEF